MYKKLGNLILIVVFISFFWLFLNSFRYPSNVYYSQNPFISLLVSIIILIVWYYIFMLLKRKIPDDISKKYKVLLVCLYFVIVTIIQFIVLTNLSVSPGWDFGVVFDNAYQFVLNGNRNNAGYIEYFEYFPNNIMLFTILVIFIKCGLVCGITAIKSALIMNVIFIDLALLLLYLTLNKKYGFKNALFGLIISLFFLPIFLYTPIFYSDTLSMFIGIGFIYLYLYLSESENFKKSIWILIAIGILFFLGKEIKITSLIVLLAVLFHYLSKTNLKRYTLSLFVIGITFLVCSFSFKILIVQNPKFAFSQTGYGSYPHTHWIMMGVEDKDADNSGRNSIGGYNSNDYELTRKYNGKDAVIFNLKEYGKRVKKLGVVGYFDYLTKKGVNAWSDGLYFSDVKLSLNPINPSSKLYQILLVNQNTKYALIYFSQGVQFAFLILLIGGCLLKRNKEIDYIRLSILGLMIFLLFWENRSRYLLNFVPLFIIVIVEFYYIIEKKLKCKISDL